MDSLGQALQQSEPYLSFWNPDFLSEVLRRKGTVARYYPNLRLAVDVGRPKSKLSLRKCQLLSLRGIRYFCLPKNSKEQTLLELLLGRTENTMATKKLRFPRLSTAPSQLPN